MVESGNEASAVVFEVREGEAAGGVISAVGFSEEGDFSNFSFFKVRFNSVRGGIVVFDIFVTGNEDGDGFLRGGVIEGGEVGMRFEEGVDGGRGFWVIEGGRGFFRHKGFLVHGREDDIVFHAGDGFFNGFEEVSF